MTANTAAEQVAWDERLNDPLKDSNRLLIKLEIPYGDGGMDGINILTMLMELKFTLTIIRFSTLSMTSNSNNKGGQTIT